MHGLVPALYREQIYMHSCVSGQNSQLKAPLFHGAAGIPAIPTVRPSAAKASLETEIFDAG
jgi:hypothetical protein